MSTNPVWTPAEDINRDDSQNEPRHFTMRSFLILRLVFRADILELLNHEIIEHQNET